MALFISVTATTRQLDQRGFQGGIGRCEKPTAAPAVGDRDSVDRRKNVFRPNVRPVFALLAEINSDWPEFPRHQRSRAVEYWAYPRLFKSSRACKRVPIGH
ncbi:hypothetical protein CCR94_10810 [Rhodoblastus sphagnicola]|uniref:Uncharacterized protein n=1 Tax=Rhodoblastus sphagnicola TaxID=333368 RepID=A0A2S6N8M0_9HYPH|nr:hypothetical protein CCR94_10810 [Rhodoblastus sphagnicola]